MGVNFNYGSRSNANVGPDNHNKTKKCRAKESEADLISDNDSYLNNDYIEPVKISKNMNFEIDNSSASHNIS